MQDVEVYVIHRGAALKRFCLDRKREWESSISCDAIGHHNVGSAISEASDREAGHRRISRSTWVDFHIDGQIGARGYIKERSRCPERHCGKLRKQGPVDIDVDDRTAGRARRGRVVNDLDPGCLGLCEQSCQH
jgi:hypothetical protein